ncbi:MAG: hypothetical protein R3220_12965 [Balneolaceae bacterium]|nr:hypothetical protein [Balneolaceae bacterium]
MKLKNVNAIELVLFKPKPSVSEDEVKNSLTSLNSVLQSYDGFIARQLAKGKEDQWMDLVFWESMQDASFAAEDVLKNEKAIKAFEVIDERQMNFFHSEPVSQIFKHEPHSEG